LQFNAFQGERKRLSLTLRCDNGYTCANHISATMVQAELKNLAVEAAAAAVFGLAPDKK